MAPLFALDLRPALSMFSQTAADAYGQCLEEDELERLLELQDQELDQQWSELTSLAELGQEDAVAAPFDVLLREWARKKGYQVILENFGMVLDRNDQEFILGRFWEALQRKHQILSTQLRTILIRGREAREQAARARSEQLLPHAARMLQDQHDQASSWYQAAERVLRDRETAIWEGQAIAHEWAFRAADSMDKQQAGLDSQYRFVESVHGNVTEMLKPAYQQQLAYNVASEYRSQVVKSRMGCILIGLAIVAVLIGVGVFAMFHVV